MSKETRISTLITLIALITIITHIMKPTLMIDSITLWLLVIAFVPWFPPLVKSIGWGGIRKEEISLTDKDYIRVLTTPFCVVLGVFGVIYIFNQSMTIMPNDHTLDTMKEATTVAGSAIAMIGTLVGFVAGQAVGAAGKEKADDRADSAMDKAMKAEKKAGIISGMAPSGVMEKVLKEHGDLFQ